MKRIPGLLLHQVLVACILCTVQVLLCAAPEARFHVSQEVAHASVVRTVQGFSDYQSVPYNGPLTPTERRDEITSQLRNIKNLPGLNRAVVDELLRFPTDGTHQWWWQPGIDDIYDGATEDFVHEGVRYLRGDTIARRCHPCGLTMQVVLEVLADQDRWPANLNAATATSFRKLWFALERGMGGPADALVAFGLGQKIEKLEDAEPGDFIQVWFASGRGATGIFVGSAETSATKNFYMWSALPAGAGIGFSVHTVGPGGSDVAPDQLHIARLLPSSAWVADEIPQRLQEQIQQVPRKDVEVEMRPNGPAPVYP